MIAALSLCIVLAGSVLIYEFYEHLADRLEEALTAEAREIIGQIDPDAPRLGLNGDALRFRGAEGSYRYTVFDPAGEVIVGGETSPAIRAQLGRLELGQPQLINLPGDRTGIGLHSQVNGLDVIALVSTYPPGNESMQFQTLMYEIKEQIMWVILGVAVLLGTAVYATRRAMMPLKRLSQQAAKVGPADTHQRLTTDGVPVEIVPLVQSVNGAFERLEAGYRAQRDFSSNVAHEIRTPIAVLRSSVDRIDDPALKDSLIQDVMQLEQIFQQLIDLARADAAHPTSFTQVDLHELAVTSASEMAQTALKDGQTLSVTGARQELVQGNPGLLGIALRNVIHNALQHAPRGSDVEIKILSGPAGWQVLDRGPGVPDEFKTDVFERFNRGTQANAKSTGFGIGLAIVKSVAKSHGATVGIQDRARKGSAFSFVFKG